MTQPWTTVVKQWNPAGLYKRKGKAGISLLLATEGAELDQLVQEVAIDITADDYKQRLENRFTMMYPDTLPGMETEYTRRLQISEEFQQYSAQVAQVNDVVNQVALTGVVVGAFPLGSSVFAPTMGVYGQAINMKPGYWFGDSSSTAFNSSYLAGQANPGDYLGDLNPKAAVGLYINQGTLAVPAWNRADSQMMVDLIYDPYKILECGYDRIYHTLKLYATDVPVGASLEWRYVYFAPYVAKQLQPLERKEELSFSLLRVDRAANGIISDFDQDADKITTFFA